MDDDLISRSALKEAINDNGCRHSHYFDIFDIIDNAPAVSFMISPDYVTELQNLNKDLIKQLEELERPQGKWIITGEEQGALGITYKIRKCSNCGWEHSLVIPNNFCPRCGAEMRKKNLNG